MALTPAEVRRALEERIRSAFGISTGSFELDVTPYVEPLVTAIDETGVSLSSALDHVERALKESRASPLSDALSTAGDVVLAAECGAGNPRAVRALDGRYGALIDACAARTRDLPESVQDFRRGVLSMVLEPRPSQEPRICGYRGRGTLAGWLKVIAVRRGLQLSRAVRSGPEEFRGGDALASDDPELEFMRQEYRDVFAAAFERAVEQLSRRERNLLRYSVVEGLGVEQIGAIYHLPRSTAARHVARAREHLRALVHACILDKLAVSPATLASIAAMVRSELDISVRRVLGGKPRARGTD